ncbi:SGNH/GDSL hydrolase family protein [Pseudonocardia sp. CA-107938]|uniref:SGNH/GDSL hydrolase family protein n=1 Tax=Pseudonocardia sp. CA-107938 TaxID=3240021 RepID=UPI003D9080B0
MEERWIATWGTAQQLAPAAEAGGGPEMPDEEPDSDTAPAVVDAQTVRMVARCTVGGTAVRVALSNSFGHAPVRIGAASLARGDGFARLTFGGRDTVVLPAGALIHSDPVELEVPPQTDLVVSLHLPDEEVTPTVHPVGLRTAWLAPGDQVVAAELQGATAFRSYLWLTGIDVRAPATAATVIALGDSLVDGMETTPDADAPWPSALARRLAGHPPRAVINMGIAGNRVLRETDGMGAAALARFDRDVLARPGARWIILLEGGNDAIFGLMPGMPESERATAADIVTGYRTLIARAHLHQLRVIGCTWPPIGGSPVWTPEFEDVRRQVNGWIRESGEFDAVTDLDAALRDPAAPTTMPGELLSGDGVHPNDAGHAAIAELFDLALLRE